MGDIKSYTQSLWHYDTRSETYLMGTQDSGCGVYTEDGVWYGNVVICNNIMIGICREITKEAAMKACEDEYFSKVSLVGLN